MLSLFSNFAQDYSYYTYAAPNTSSGLGTAMIIYIIILIAIYVLAAISLWRIFKKAGQPGWAAIIPIYNYLTLLKVIGRPWWWVLAVLFGLIPVVGWIANLIVAAIVLNDLAKSFGKGTGTTVALICVVGFPVLAFSDAKYRGPAALNTLGGLKGPASSHGSGAHPKA
ncbi:MAG TPA: DUF5684 domain-containing protein [Candidatus Saccharimonadales bacterium]|jgi:hypothetical protein|nr:DUF5684 domain-containing protein [Candidatus Saccharimonadales bacterium]